MRKKIGEVLVEKKLVSQTQIDQILKEQQHSNKLIGELLVEKQLLSELLLYQALAHQHKMGFVDLEAAKIDTKLLHKVPLASAQKYAMLPIEIRDELLVVAVANPRTQLPVNELTKLTGADDVQPVLCLPDQVKEAIRKYY